jgi:hypothetical protein
MAIHPSASRSLSPGDYTTACLIIGGIVIMLIILKKSGMASYISLESDVGQGRYCVIFALMESGGGGGAGSLLDLESIMSFTSCWQVQEDERKVLGVHPSETGKANDPVLFKFHLSFTAILIWFLYSSSPLWYMSTRSLRLIRNNLELQHHLKLKCQPLLPPVPLQPEDPLRRKRRYLLFRSILI